MRTLCLIVVTATAASTALAQWSVQGSAREADAHVYAMNFIWDGGQTSASDSFTNSFAPGGTWSTDDTAFCDHHGLGSAVRVKQDSDISATSLTSAGSMTLQHGQPPSLSTAKAYGHHQYSATVEVATPTEVAIDFALTKTVGSIGSINNYQCVFSISSNVGFSAMAGDAAGFPLPGSYSYAGILSPGTYSVSIDMVVDEEAAGSSRHALSWEYDWNMSMQMVPAPGAATVLGVGGLVLGKRRR